MPDPKNLSSSEKRALLQQLLQQKASLKRLNLDAEAVLAADISAAGLSLAINNQTQSIFLTGATGFLGAFLLAQLCQSTSADIYCLVRAANIQEAQQRLQQNLEAYLLWQDSFSDRLNPVIGDLALPLLGLSSAAWQELSQKIDAIYHNGASINFAYPYSAIAPINVFGTQEVLRLASQFKLKPVHYVSTLGVFESAFFTGKLITETDPLPSSNAVSFGYTQSKWVAEKLISIARDRGLIVSVYRPPVIAGDRQTGRFNPSDFIWSLVKACIQLGSAPNLPAAGINFVPVDYVSQSIACLSGQSALWGKTFHLANPHSFLPWNQLFDWINSRGYAVKLIPAPQWLEMLKAASDRADRFSLLAAVMEATKATIESAFASTKMSEFDCQNTILGLADCHINCPPPASLLEVYFNYFIASGFLTSPGDRNLV